MSALRTPLLPLAALVLVLAACASAPPGPSAPESGSLPVEGGSLAYEVRGSGPEAVVLLHGGFGDRRMWDGQMEPFARRFRVVRYDQRGFGASPAPAAAYSPVADLLRLLDHLGVARAHLVGNSMGASLALDAALLHPDRFGKLVVAANGANGYPYTPEDTAGVVAVFQAAAREGPERAAELWLEHPMVKVTSRDPATAPLLREMVTANRGIFLMRHWPAERLDPPAFERLGELRNPVLFLLGEDDTPLVRRAAEETAARIPHARKATLSGADHLPQMARPAEFNRLVLEFLAE